MIPLRPLPDLDPLKPAEVAAAIGMRRDTLVRHLRAGNVPGAFRNPGEGAGPGRWRIPHATAVQLGRELGVWP